MDVIGNSKVLPCPEPSKPGQRANPNVRQPRGTSRALISFCINRIVRRKFLIFFLFSVFVTAGGVRSQALDRDSEGLVHFGDLIDVDVFGSFEYDWRGGLTPDGNLDISENYTEPIYALCRSEAEISAEIVKLLGKTLRDPKVAVRILDRSNRAVARLDGAVRTPTRFQIKRPVRLRELIVMAGGLIDGASGEISIFRPQNASCKPDMIPATAAGIPDKDNAPGMTIIKIPDLLSGKSGADPIVFSGDVVTVAKALPVYIIGAVVNPRPVYSREKMSLSRLISTAGGLSKEADSSKVFIFRRSGIEVKSIEVDLEKIKKGETNDEILEPFDIIEVAAKGGVKRKYPPVMANDRGSENARPNPPLRIVD